MWDVTFLDFWFNFISIWNSIFLSSNNLIYCHNVRKLHTTGCFIQTVTYLSAWLSTTLFMHSFTLENTHVKARHAVCLGSFNMHYFTSFWHWGMWTNIIHGQTGEKSGWTAPKITQLLLGRLNKWDWKALEKWLNVFWANLRHCSVTSFPSLSTNVTEVHLSFLSYGAQSVPQVTSWRETLRGRQCKLDNTAV